MADRESRFEDSDVESIKTDPNSRSSESNYSDDTFESTTNESDASHSYKSESFESYTYAEETDSRSSSFPQVHPTKGEHSGFGDAPSVEKERIIKWIGTLQEKTGNRQSKEVIKSLSGAGEEAADEGRDALQTFCFNKIRQIRHSSSSKKQDCRRKKTTQSRKAATSDVNSAAPSALVNRMYLNNIMATMKQRIQPCLRLRPRRSTLQILRSSPSSSPVPTLLDPPPGLLFGLLPWISLMQDLCSWTLAISFILFIFPLFNDYS
ncbi:uncharacterized protein C8orf48 homolog isoform X2 [Lissotriton helveticus]